MVAAAVVAGALLLVRPFDRVRHVTVVRVVSTPAPAPALARAPAADPAAPAARTPLPPASAGLAATAANPGHGSLFRAGVDASFARFSAGQPGSVEIAVAPVGSGTGARLGGNRADHAWSTSKVPVLVALLRARGSLTSQEQQWAQLAITQSDNQSILDLFGDLERSQGGLVGASQYIETLLRASGDLQTVVATAPPPPGAVTTFGQTRWAPGQAVKFFRALGRGCLLPASQSAYVIGLMRNIVPSESWGLGSAGFSVPVAFKGGWGPEPTGYLVRQSGIIDPGSTRGLAVSIVVRPSNGSFGSGTQMLTSTARWLRAELRLNTHPRPTTCAGA